MKVKIKKLQTTAEIPKYSKNGDAGLDIHCTGVSFDENTSILTYTTGLSIEIPEGHVGLIFPRSSISKKDLILTNSVGVIDSGYRGEILLKFRLTDRPIGPKEYFHDTYSTWDRIAQLVIIPYPQIEFEEVEELEETERGSGGFGSTGL